MITQGFPLWAMEFDGTAHAVVGWSEQGYPYLLPMQERATGPQLVLTGETFTFTTTDPTEQTSMDPTERIRAAVYPDRAPRRPDSDLRQRLTALADEITGMDGTAASAAELIRTELNK